MKYLKAAAVSWTAILAAAAAGAFAEPTAVPDDYRPRAGEIRLDGTLRSADAAGGKLLLDAVSFTLPSGRTARFPEAREKVLLLDDEAAVHVRGDRGRKLDLAALMADETKPIFAIAVGKDGGSGQPLLCRELALWDREAEGRFRLGVAAPAKEPSRIAPACRIVAPKPGDPAAGPTVRVVIEATDDRGIEDLQVTVNGQKLEGAKPIAAGAKPILPGAKAIPAGHQMRDVYTVDLPVPSDARQLRIRAIVRDADDLTGTAEVVVERGAGTPGRLFLLSIGIGQYRLPQYNLPYAAADAGALAEVLVAQKGKQYSEIVPVLLTDTRASAGAIRGALSRLRAARPEDLVLVFISGHALRTDSDSIYLALPGIILSSTEQTCLPWTEVVRTLSAVRARRLLITDLCHSGNRLGNRLATSEMLAGSLRGTGIVMIASSSGAELARSNPQTGHGAFTAAMLEALSGKASAQGSDTVTLLELLTYLKERLPRLTGGAQRPWVPALEDFDPRLPLVRLR